MLNVYCWRCGTRIKEESVLGLGHFDHGVGKYGGKGFIAFNCPKCKKARYQILDGNFTAVQKQVGQQYQNSPADRLDLNQVIDFHRALSEIRTIDSFLERCELDSDSVTTGLKKPILQPLDVYNVFSELNTGNQRRLMILTLDADNYLVNWDFLGEGAHGPISFEPRAIFRDALLMDKKAGVIIAHNLNNHFTQPSQKDILMTKRLIKAGKVLGIDFLDHIVIEEDGFHSYDQLKYI